MEIEYNDKLVPGGRRPRLYLAKGGSAAKFEGLSIPGFCVVLSAEFEKKGKWSNTTYQISLAAGVRPIKMLSPLHQLWGHDLQSWGAACERLQLPIDVTREIVYLEYPDTAERLDKIEEAEASLGDDDDHEIVVVAFGAPTNRQIRGGYWDEPKSAKSNTGEDVVVAPDPDWNNPVVVSPSDARIISVRHSPGHHGGYYYIEVMMRS